MLLISIPVLADIDTNSEAFQLYADTDRSQKPELIEQDNILIAKATHTFGTREHAAEGYVERGFNFYSEDKLIQSMEYFNQAWLLDNNNAYIYLGYGLIFKKNKQPCTATKQFQKANEKGLKESGFFADYAYTLTECAVTKEKSQQPGLFQSSNNLHILALETPNKLLQAYVYHSWAKSFFLQGNYLKSHEMLEQSKTLGGRNDAALEKSIQEKSQN
jgi:tetratricopeptide (TPR) repeat protein